MKLVMTLRTRDQADIVDAVVAFHLSAGVDFVIATDHRSEDGTAEILEEYARAGVLHLIREHGAEVRGSEWRTRMARMAAVDFGADWTFSCDGDEFWWPRGSSLKESLEATPQEYGVVQGLVRHFVPLARAGGAFWERMTVRYAPPAAVHSPMSPFRPYFKVAHRADPTVIVHRGNHELRRTRHRALLDWCPLEVLHFPIRTAEQATRKYLAWADVFGSEAKGTHLTTARAEREGTVDAHAAAYLLSDEVVRRGLREGVLEHDTRLREVLGQLECVSGGARRFALPGESAWRPLVAATPPSFVADNLAARDAHWIRLARRLDQIACRVASMEPSAGKRHG